MFGSSPDNPIRCSKLDQYVKCSLKMFLQEMTEQAESEGGPPAQTGSLTHAGVAAYHKFKGSQDQKVKAGWDAIAANREIFSLADTEEVRLFYTPYVNDPRNIEAEFAVIPSGPLKGELAIEHEINFTLPPHELDQTGLPIYVQGHMDQVRVRNRIPCVDDLKTGKKTGLEMIHDYAYQIAGYTYGLRQLWFPDCQPGNIIRAQGYRTRDAKLVPNPSGVMWAMPFTWKGVEWLLENVRFHIAMLRNGVVNPGPGPHCTYCEFGGLSGCRSQWDRLINSGRITLEVVR